VKKKEERMKMKTQTKEKKKKLSYRALFVREHHHAGSAWGGKRGLGERGRGGTGEG
jgi:hypothetical protein